MDFEKFGCRLSTISSRWARSRSRRARPLTSIARPRKERSKRCSFNRLVVQAWKSPKGGGQPKPSLAASIDPPIRLR